MKKLHNFEFRSVCCYVWDVKSNAIRGTKGTQKVSYPEVVVIILGRRRHEWSRM